MKYKYDRSILYFIFFIIDLTFLVFYVLICYKLYFSTTFHFLCQGMDKVEAIIVTFQNGSTTLSFEALSSMKKLRLLMILGCFGVPKNGSATPKLDHLSNNLRLLEWNRFPFKEFPPTFQPEKLVKLKLTKSNLERLFWNKSVKVFVDLFPIFFLLLGILELIHIHLYVQLI